MLRKDAICWKPENVIISGMINKEADISRFALIIQEGFLYCEKLNSNKSVYLTRVSAVAITTSFTRSKDGRCNASKLSNCKYRPFNNSLPKSSVHMNWRSVRNYEMGVRLKLNFKEKI